MAGAPARRVITIGIGGKTILARHLQRVLPGTAHIIHQDDFCPPADKVPYSKQYPDLQDWDDPETCILWPEFRSMLKQIKETGHHGPHSSHDHLNKQVEIKVEDGTFQRRRDQIKAATKEDTVWYIVDGFVLYYDPLFLRVPYEVLKQRREERHVYVLQPEGGVWEDPPEYFDKIVWPGYIKAHQDVFPQDGPPRYDLTVIEPRDGEEGITEAFDQACEAILNDQSRSSSHA
ncbi:hypothetical protein IAU60_006812 [Kwoniella sp. DSM 27419]